MTALRGKRILVVEDEPLVATAIEEMLLKLGAEVVRPAGTLSRALELARSAELDAELLDVNLRGEQGDPIAAVLNAGAVPYVFATGYGLESEPPTERADLGEAVPDRSVGARPRVCANQDP